MHHLILRSPHEPSDPDRAGLMRPTHSHLQADTLGALLRVCLRPASLWSLSSPPQTDGNSELVFLAFFFLNCSVTRVISFTICVSRLGLL